MPISDLTPTMRDTLSKVLDQINSRITADLSLDDLFKIDSEIGELKSVYDSILDSEVLEKNINLETLITTVQQKLDNGDFKGEPFTYNDFTPQQIENLKVKGDPFTYQDFTTQQLQDLKGDKGTSITNVINQDGKLIIEDSENKQYDLGNFQNDYNNLINNTTSLIYKGSFKTIGDADKYYPYRFIPVDKYTFSRFILFRKSVHEDVPEFGRFFFDLTLLGSNWGHGAEFIKLNKNTFRTNYFIADYFNEYERNETVVFIKGSSTIYVDTLNISTISLDESIEPIALVSDHLKVKVV